MRRWKTRRIEFATTATIAGKLACDDTAQGGGGQVAQGFKKKPQSAHSARASATDRRGLIFSEKPDQPRRSHYHSAKKNRAPYGTRHFSWRSGRDYGRWRFPPASKSAVLPICRPRGFSSRAEIFAKKTGPLTGPGIFRGGVDGTRTRDPRRDRPVSITWWVLTGSNRRPSPCKGDALPAELSTRSVRRNVS